ncbi:MAG: hypothetical protein EA394_04200 [Bacteroidia bacterium]|nr:MAG: hypothetical protein EA394_04200 [Bacteroidia bacterium]
MKMKKFLRVLAFFMLACFAVCLTACDKDDDKDNGSGTGGYHMTAKIDGKSWASAGNQMILVDNKMGYLFISGAVNDDDDIITIQMFDFPGAAGSFSLGTDEYQTHCFYTSPEGVTFYVFPDEPDAFGVLVITDYKEKYIKGSFSFTAIDNSGENMIEVTDGSFHMPVYSVPK